MRCNSIFDTIDKFIHTYINATPHCGCADFPLTPSLNIPPSLNILLLPWIFSSTPPPPLNIFMTCQYIMFILCGWYCKISPPFLLPPPPPSHNFPTICESWMIALEWYGLLYTITKHGIYGELCSSNVLMPYPSSNSCNTMTTRCWTSTFPCMFRSSREYHHPY